MKQAEQVSAADARDRLTDMMNRARYGGERFVLTKNGRPVAVLSGAQEFPELMANDESAA